MNQIAAKSAAARFAALFGLVASLCFAPPARAQMLEVATELSPVGLDPHVATSFATQLITSTVYEGLTGIDGHLRVEPVLARAWTISEDGRTYRFELRSGVTFHNGRPLTPADVVASLARVRDPKTASPYASRFAQVQAVEAEGDGVVAIRLEQPSAPLPAQLAAIAIVPAGAGAGLARQPVGTGPFRFSEWIPDTAIVVTRATDYWQPGLPRLAGVKFNIVPEAMTRRIGLQSGTYHLLPALDWAAAGPLERQADVTILPVQDLAYSLVGLNVTRAPFDKPEVREALNYGLDRARIAQAAYYGKAVPAGPLSPALGDWALPVSDFPCYRPDPAKARALLQQAGQAEPVKLALNVLGGLQQVVDIAQVVQAQLDKAGFEVTLNVQEQGKFIQDWRAGNFQGFVSLNSGGPDPDDYFGRTFATGGATNVFKYSDARLDQLLTEARAARDPTARKARYDEAQRLLACRGPIAHLAYGTLFTVVRAGVKDFTPIATRSLRGLRDVSLAK